MGIGDWGLGLLFFILEKKINYKNKENKLIKYKIY